MGKQGKPPRFTREQWKAIDWNQTRRQIADQLGCSIQLVGVWARKLDQSVHADKPGPDSRVDWQKVDWSKSNTEIGRELGLSGAWVGVMRKRTQI